MTVKFRVPTLGGDTVYTAAITSSGGHTVAVPVIVRTLVPTSGANGGVFGGTITGGNARGGAPAQTFSFAFDVPRGKKDLDLSTVLSKDPGDLLETVLIDPNGETPSIGSNVVFDGKAASQGRGAQNYVANPLPGRWRSVVVVLDPVTGNELPQDFRWVVAFDRVTVSASPAVPNSAAVTLPAGRPVAITVSVTNTGVAPLPLQVDRRLNGLTALQLAPVFGDPTVPLPVSVDDLSGLPGFLVPPARRAPARPRRRPRWCRSSGPRPARHRPVR